MRSYLEFQSTPLCEGRLRFFCLMLVMLQFQSTPLCEGRLRGVVVDFNREEFQSTPLCEGRQSQWFGLVELF